MLINSKRKLKSQVSLHAWLFGKRLDFVAPMPLEECASRLAAKSEPRRWVSWSNPVTVSLSKAPDHYGFRLQKDVSSNVPVWVLGDLERIDDDSTLVTGHGSISPWTYLVMLLVFPLWFVILQHTSFDAGIPYITFSGIVVTILWAMSVAARDSLIRIVYATLSNESKS